MTTAPTVRLAKPPRLRRGCRSCRMRPHGRCPRASTTRCRAATQHGVERSAPSCSAAGGRRLLIVGSAGARLVRTTCRWEAMSTSRSRARLCWRLGAGSRRAEEGRGREQARLSRYTTQASNSSGRSCVWRRGVRAASHQQDRDNLLRMFDPGRFLFAVTWLVVGVGASGDPAWQRTSPRGQRALDIGEPAALAARRPDRTCTHPTDRPHVRRTRSALAVSPRPPAVQQHRMRRRPRPSAVSVTQWCQTWSNAEVHRHTAHGPSPRAASCPSARSAGRRRRTIGAEGVTS